MREDCAKYYECRKPVELCKKSCPDYTMERRVIKKTFGDFETQPSDEQMEYFKRGGR